jgi:hypothetical protein
MTAFYTQENVSTSLPAGWQKKSRGKRRPLHGVDAFFFKRKKGR